MLEALGGEIVAWEAQPDDRARLDSIFRFVHTVKGNCGFFEFPRLEALSHAAEDALADVRAGRRQADPALVSAVLAIIDQIGEMVAAIEAGGEMPAGDDSALIDALAPGAESAATPAATQVAEGKAPAAPRTIRLSVELLDRVMSTVSDMVLARNELARRLRESSTEVSVDGAFERLSSIIAEMRDAITRTRMQRIENLFVGLPRMVRDLSSELGKQVLVDIEGGDVELDREMIEMIRDPLTHIIRNAVDHGIEKPPERLKAGKREIGILSVSARQSGNQILIDIHDDGRGIDGKKLVAKAVAAGIVEADAADQLSPRDQLALIFEAGLSTAKEVTSISGRGVGMDVVRSNIERIGGIVEVDSKLGEGTRMTLRVPLTLTIIPALTVSIGSHHCASPRSAIEEIVRANGESVTLEHLGGAGVATIRGRRVPEVSLAEILGLQSEVEDSDRRLIGLRPAGGDVYALSVDKIHDHEELVVKPAAGQLRVQVGEAILPLAGTTPETLGEGKLRLFRLNDGEHEIGYAFAEVIDFAVIDGEIIHADTMGEVSSVSLVNGEPAELVDPHWLFANHVGVAARASQQLVCRLPGDDPWMQNMLRPMVEAAGYRVVGDEHDGDADLVIAADGEKVDAANTIYLRSELEPKNKKDPSIYRYDRAGLLMALKSATGGK
jgi:two-component system chemotaxis sensor kinase CheA